MKVRMGWGVAPKSLAPASPTQSAAPPAPVLLRSNTSTKMQAAQLQARATRPSVARRTTVRVQAQQAAPRAQASGQ